MATITIPFPSTETLLGPELARAASPPKINVKSSTRKQPGFKKHTAQSKSLNGIAKPKQTKSRNGCHTCKEKRLKCDETKPTCDQCKKRNVECGGYNKIFQWRPEEKATFRAGPTPKSRKRSTTVKEYNLSSLNATIPGVPEHATGSAAENPVPIEVHTFPPDPQLHQQAYEVANSKMDFDSEPVTPDSPEAHQFSEVVDSSACTLLDDEEREYYNEIVAPGSAMTIRSGMSFEDSPTFDEVLFHADNFHNRTDWHGPLVYQYLGHEMLDPFGEGLEIGVEEINKGCLLPQPWSGAYPSPSPSDSSSSSNGSTITLSTIHKEPTLNPFGTEMLITRFASETCGILSIKDGQNENPWRTMLLPMSFGVPALHHAILCLSAFHASREDKRFRITGLQHMQKSIHSLSHQLGTMRRDTALATTLVLAFSESWNEETSTGIRHLKAARTLMTQAIATHKGNADFEEMERLKFLHNTWIYMDVIARITAIDCDDLESMDSLFAPVYGPESQNEELDPLMGCASDLFPIIGRVANLVREVRKTPSNSPRIVSKAAELKDKILKWRAPPHLQVPQDESIEIAHTLSTAEAYRWSALLFLFQAVPMIATESPAVLAERILFDLVSVPLTSRVTIIQIFPLLVAGCEIVGEDDRLLVRERWKRMTKRMTIGNLDRCSDVVEEVWIRRDEAVLLVEGRDDQAMMHGVAPDELAFPLRHGSTLSPTTSPPSVVRPDQLYRQHSDVVFDIDHSKTVRGYGHWLTVMEDWDWAVLLG